MHSVGSDLIILWVATLTLVFMFMFGGALSIESRENTIVTYGGISLVLLGAIFVTIGQLTGFIGVW